jgi:hypothetical protein
MLTPLDVRALRGETFYGMTPAWNPSVAAPKRPVVLALVSVVIGGLCGWTAVFSGMSLWGLALGGAIAAAMITILARRDAANDMLGTMLMFGFAFVLLTWPVLWLVVGYIRYVITGETLGA